MSVSNELLEMNEDDTEQAVWNTVAEEADIHQTSIKSKMSASNESEQLEKNEDGAEQAVGNAVAEEAKKRALRNGVRAAAGLNPENDNDGEDTENESSDETTKKNDKVTYYYSSSSDEHSQLWDYEDWNEPANYQDWN